MARQAYMAAKHEAEKVAREGYESAKQIAKDSIFGALEEAIDGDPSALALKGGSVLGKMAMATMGIPPIFA